MLTTPAHAVPRVCSDNGFRRRDVPRVHARPQLDYALWGQERETAIRAAKVVLNVHYYEDAALEVHRINHLLTCGKVRGGAGVPHNR